MSEQRPRDEHDEALDTVAYDLPATRLLPFHRLTSNRLATSPNED